MYQRLAELAEARLYDQSKAFHWWCEALVEDPRWERALEESERLAGETGAWDEHGRRVHARARADARTRTSSGATLLRMARVYEFELHDAAQRGRDAPRACSRSSRRTPTRSPRSIASTSTPGCTTTSPRSCAAASRWSRIPTSSSSCTSAAARSSATRSATSTRRSAATRRSSIRRAATGAPSRRSRASTSAARTGRSCSRPTRS